MPLLTTSAPTATTGEDSSQGLEPPPELLELELLELELLELELLELELLELELLELELLPPGNPGSGGNNITGCGGIPVWPRSIY
jgi:hypothetical protein